MLAQIQADLPVTPAEVVEIWLLPLARRVGWPPTDKNNWVFILGSDTDLTHLKQLRWEKRTLELKPSIIRPRDMGIVVDILRAHVLKQWTIFSSMSDGAERFNNARSFLKEHGTFPRPIVLEVSSDGFRVRDGFHRLTAFFYLYGYFKIENEEVPCLEVRAEQEVWVATRVSLSGAR